MPQIDGYDFFYDLEPRYSPSLGIPAQQLTIGIPGNGCLWYKQSKGQGCPFCAFPGLTEEITGGEILGTSIFGRMFQESVQAHPDPDRLAVFNGGSFFPAKEIPWDFRPQVYQYVADRPAIGQLAVESKPEYIDTDVLAQATNIMDGNRLAVGIGLESSNDLLRKSVLKKGISRRSFEASVALMQSMEVRIFVYVFLKAPGLSEKEAIADVLETCRYLHNLGVDEMALSCAFVQAGTPLAIQYQDYQHRGVEDAYAFRPPRLWSILHIVEEAHRNGWPLSVGGFDDHPTPIAIASNCPECDPGILEGINHYRTFGDIIHLRGHSCSCRQEWDNLCS